MSINKIFKNDDSQRGSLFLTKLPPEIRRLIFIELFGGSRVHIAFLDHNSQTFKRERHPKGPFPRFYHCVCRSKRDVRPHKLRESNHEWCYLSINILFTCTWAYQSGISVLYTTNTFAFDGLMDLSMFRQWTSDYFGLIKYTEMNLLDPKRHGSSEKLYDLGSIPTCLSDKISLRISFDVPVRGILAKALATMNFDLFLIKLRRTDIRKVEFFLPATLKSAFEKELSFHEGIRTKVVLHFQDGEVPGVAQSGGTEFDAGET